MRITFESSPLFVRMHIHLYAYIFFNLNTPIFESISPKDSVVPAHFFVFVGHLGLYSVGPHLQNHRVLVRDDITFKPLHNNKGHYT